MSETVVVTGASGFIGKHVTKALLDSGRSVRATVRSDAKAEATRAAMGPDVGERLTFVHLDLTRDDGWDDAIAGADALLHTASPFPLGNPKDPDELIRPAVDGTLRALRAAQRAGVERVVVTSSCVAIYGDQLRPGQTVFDETNWSDPDAPGVSPYDASKTLAERAAWDFVEQEASELRLSTVNPGVVLGAPLDDDYGTSLGLVERLLNGEDPMLPKIQMPIVDVLDVAAMHVRSLDVDEAAGERFAAVAGALWFTEMAEVLNDEFPSSRAKTREAPNFLLKLMARFNNDLTAVVPRLGRVGAVSGEKAERVLGIEFTTARDAVVNAGRALAA